MNNKINKIYIFFTLFYAYFVLALFECARGNFIPFFIDEFAISNTSISMIISISQFGCVIGYYFAGNISQKYGQKITFILGTSICTIIALSARYLNNVTVLCVFYFIFNIGRSFLCISVDSIVPMVSIGYEVLFINLTHFMYGIGSFTGQKIYGNLLFNNISWRSIYFVLGLIFLFSVVFVLFIKIPKNKYLKTTIKYDKKTFYKNPLLHIFILCFALSSAGEGMITTWFINYMTSSYNLTAINTAKYSSLFFITFALGRLFGGLILQKIGTMKGLKIFMISATICVLCGMMLKQNGLYIISISGFFISVLYPTLVVFSTKVFKECPSLAIGTITTCNSLIYILITIIVGFLNDSIGSYLTFYLAAIFMGLSFLLLKIISKKHKLN
ncbi:MFS transporter [Sedimentibacter sp. zth1]|uniref:MFS transporter n=1 Tax=Sedimentibacter sp. zth1 TaxID=2816908 RepID=UPI001A9124E8|nr:MFS transporter [Sedimentibacter sp. zth1]QSX04898.1 MFS transporter [Sedimentibacter sp. zth1]